MSFQSIGAMGILAVREDCGGTLKDIYENGYISRADLEKIYDIHNEQYQIM